MTTNDLAGTLALVHPELKDDPARKEGQVGMITYVSAKEHDVYMRFDNGDEARYAPDAILTLKEKNNILNSLMDNTALEVKDFKDLYKIGQLQDFGRPQDTIRALEIAAGNPGIRESAVQTIASIMDLNRVQTIGR